MSGNERVYFHLNYDQNGPYILGSDGNVTRLDFPPPIRLVDKRDHKEPYADFPELKALVDGFKELLKQPEYAKIRLFGSMLGDDTHANGAFFRMSRFLWVPLEMASKKAGLIPESCLNEWPKDYHPSFRPNTKILSATDNLAQKYFLTRYIPPKKIQSGQMYGVDLESEVPMSITLYYNEEFDREGKPVRTEGQYMLDFQGKFD